MEHLDALFAIPELVAYLEGGHRLFKIGIEACRGEAAPDAIQLTEAFVAEAESLEDMQAIVPLYETAALVHLTVGSESDAAEFARKIVDRSGGSRFLVDAWSFTVWLLRRSGELDRIGILLPELRRFDMPRPRALIAIVEALLGEDDDPAAALEAIDGAAIELAELGVFTEATIALADAVRIAEGLGDSDRAVSMRVRAQELMAGTRAVVLMEKLGLA
jgi:hypothetical protein